ncbi:MAG TPA: hypothetical protein VEG38_04095 [Acidimicrobiia bacterium]|nr:hypothetical protein [Acidimicrobiia bacterium]
MRAQAVSGASTSTDRWNRVGLRLVGVRARQIDPVCAGLEFRLTDSSPRRVQ